MRRRRGDEVPEGHGKERGVLGKEGGVLGKERGGLGFQVLDREREGGIRSGKEYEMCRTTVKRNKESGMRVGDDEDAEGDGKERGGSGHIEFWREERRNG